MNQRLVLCLLLLTQPGQMREETFDTFVKRSLQQMCPYTSFCSQNATKTSNTAACCLPCSCDKSCEYGGNCCPDYKHTNRTTLANETHQCMSLIERKIPDTDWRGPRYNGLSLGIALYNTITTCPLEYKDDKVIDGCTSPIPQELVDAARVTDRKGRLYRNRYCAICHGVTDYNTWELQLTHSGRSLNVNLVEVKNAVSLLNHDFYLESLPPQSHKKLLSRCFKPDVITCNQTGKWEVYDQNLINACNSFMNGYVKIEGQTLLYKNPFCYLCNIRRDERVISTCEDFGDIRSPQSNFAALLDLQTSSRKAAAQDKAKKHVCQLDEIFDPYFDVCRRLICPIAEQPIRGQCVGWFKRSIGLTMIFQIAVINLALDVSIDEVQSTTKSVWKLLTDAIVNHTDISGTACTVCGVQIFQHIEDYPGIQHLILLDISTNKRCTVTDILDLMRGNMNKKRLFVSKASVNATISMKLAFPFQSLQDRYQVRSASWLVIPYSTRCMTGMLVTDPKFFCPYVDLRYNEYLMYTSGNVTADHALSTDFSKVTMISTSGNDTEAVYRVCVEDYLVKKTTMISAARGCKQTPWMIVFMYIVFNCNTSIN